MMVQDNASWHKAKGLNRWTILPIYLPPYSPDLNPIEILWKVIKDRLFNVIPPNGPLLISISQRTAFPCQSHCFRLS